MTGHDTHPTQIMTEDIRPPEELSFEEAMESLDAIVASLEGAHVPLEQMIASYERGMKLLRVCRSRVDSAKQRVELINTDLEGKDKARLSDFSPSSVPEPAAPTPAPSEEVVRRPQSRKKSATSESSGDGDIRLF